MTLSAEPIRPASIIERAKNILMSPAVEWDRIDGEATTVSALFRSYAVYLAAIGPICHAIRALAFGWGGYGISYHPSLVGVIVTALVSYVFTLVGLFVFGVVIEAVAPTFDGVRDRAQAMKVAVYGSTAMMLAGFFSIIPRLGILSILGLYSLYLVYLGLPKLMKSPQDKALSFTVVVLLVALVLDLVIGAITVPLQALGSL